MRIVYSYRQQEQIFDSQKAEIVVGRPGGAIPVDLDLTPDHFVSRSHARIWIEAECAWIQNLNATHGTQVNGSPLRGNEKQKLTPNDVILIGETTLWVETAFPQQNPLPVPKSHAQNAVAPRTIPLSDLPLQMAAVTELKRLLEIVVECAVTEIAGAERGSLLLGRDLLLVAHYPPESRPSTTLAYQAIEQGTAFLWPPCEPIGNYLPSNLHPPSIRSNQVEAAMYAPLLWREEVLGVLCVDNCTKERAFRSDDLQTLQTAAQYAAQAVAYHRLEEKCLRAEETIQSFLKLVPSEVGAQLRQQRGRARLGGEFRVVTVLFSDIRGFTQMSASMSAGDVTDMIEDYFGSLVSIISKRQGMVVKYIGDAIMAVFGNSSEDTEATMQAVNAALEMQQAIQSINVRRTAAGQRTITLGIGINSGEVVYGFVGTPERMEFSVIGDTVNYASRYCDGAQGGEILLSPQVHQRVWRKIASEQTTIPTKHEGLLTAYRILSGNGAPAAPTTV